MSADEYLAWSEHAPGRYELFGGEVVAQAAERAAHAKVKGETFVALRSAIRRSGVPCRAFPDGMAVRVDSSTVYEPDAQVHCGPELPPDALLVLNPVIVVEVISPSTGRNDALAKLEGYFRIPSVQHYLIVDPNKPGVIRHSRGVDETILTQIFSRGAITLDPPGPTIEIDEIYGATPTA